MLSPLGERRSSYRLKFRGYVGAGQEKRWDFVFEYRFDYRANGEPDERRFSRHHLIKHYAQTPYIGTSINLVSAGLLGRHVLRCPHYHAWRCLEPRFGLAGYQLSQAKIQQLYVPIATQHDVLRLYVAMNNTSFMCGDECIGHLQSNTQRLADRQWSTLHSLPQRLAFNKFSCNEVSALHHAYVVDRQNVWMI